MSQLKSIALVSYEIDPQYSGQNGLTYDLVRHLLKKNYEITLLCHKLSADLKSDSRVRWIKIASLPGPALLRFISFPLFATFALRNKKFDLVCCTGAMSFIFDVNIVHFVHGGLAKAKKKFNFKIGLYQELVLKINLLMESLCYRPQRHYLTVSDKLKNELQEIYKLPNVTTLWNSVTSNYQVPDRTMPLPMPKAPAKILFVGDLNRDIKNFKTLVDALKKIPAQDYVLQICAFISPHKWQETQKSLAGLSYEFLGQAKNMPVIYKQAQVLVHPCVYEPFGLVISEAYLSGLRVICAEPDTAGAATRIKNSAGVWLLKNPMDAAELTAALEAALKQTQSDRIFENWDTPAQLQERYEKELLRIHLAQ